MNDEQRTIKLQGHHSQAVADSVQAGDHWLDVLGSAGAGKGAELVAVAGLHSGGKVSNDQLNPIITVPLESDGRILGHAFSIRRQGKSMLPDLTTRLFSDQFTAAAIEQRRQEEKWGIQDHPWVHSATISNANLSKESISEYLGLPSEEVIKIDCDEAAKDGSLDFATILLEEVIEAINAPDDDAAHVELIQVAAVALSAAAAIQRRKNLHQVSAN